MKKQYIVIISSVLLVLLFVVGVQIYKGQQNKKYGFWPLTMHPFLSGSIRRL